YYLPRGFTVQYCTAAKSLVGDAPTFENFNDFVAFVGEKDSAFFKTQLQSIWFQHAMSSASEWINAEDNTAHFTDESFLAFLRSCDLCAKDEDELNANFSQTPQIAMYSAGEGLSSSFYSDNPMDLVGDPQTIFTLPSALYDGYGARTPYFLGAIVGKNNQNGAKTFVEFFLTQTLITDFGMTTFITIRQDEYDAIRNGTYIETFLPDFIPGESPYMPPNWDPITDEKSNTLITGVDHFLDGYYGDVQNIMLEEAGRYFVGDITAEQAAEFIQNRISLYLAERN
ncbi:MAG: hypothetical protein IKU11_01050, partial [Clostridia bacterium]|nr:hypothetical protein [Clostridia bacterium]